jgi:general secretion pathway protein M
LENTKHSMTRITVVTKAWQLRNQREKQGLTLAAAILISWLGWVLLVNPALRGRAHWQRELPTMQNELAQMRSLLTDIGKQPARSKESRLELSRQMLESSLNEKGLKAENLEIADGHVKARFIDISFSSFAELLQQWQIASQLVVEEVTVTARDRIDRVDVSVSLKRAL